MEVIHCYEMVRVLFCFWGLLQIKHIILKCYSVNCFFIFITIICKRVFVILTSKCLHIRFLLVKNKRNIIFFNYISKIFQVDIIMNYLQFSEVGVSYKIFKFSFYFFSIGNRETNMFDSLGDSINWNREKVTITYKKNNLNNNVIQQQNYKILRKL